ncbi:MAG: DUF4340 domain-containing protein [Gammaproteobacteria bacterium]|nr:DUF4340 domain-containing protein [Gammaproteobacteria bacterium]
MSAKTALKTLAALAAVGYLALMIWTGARPTAELVKFEEQGVMAEDPAAVTLLEITAGDRHATLERRAGGWAKAGRAAPLPAPLAASVEKVVKYLHTANPVRELGAADLAGTDARELGFEPPRATIIVKGAQGTLLTAELGSRNTDGVLQYFRVAGRPQVYLVSGFVGEEWERVLAAVLE